MIDDSDKNARVLKILQMLQSRPPEADNELATHVDGMPESPAHDELESDTDKADKTPIPMITPAKRRKLAI